VVPSIAQRIEAVTLDAVAAAAAERLKPTNRTIGWFDPQPPGDGMAAPVGEGAGAGSAPAFAPRR
jgi:hypothetical protein